MLLNNDSGIDPEESPKDAALDPELQDDLGAEFEYRGDQLEAALQDARAESQANLESAQRIQAEFENFRKRLNREQSDALKRAGERIVLALLPVVDNLERAIDHTTAGGAPEDLLSGVEMVHRQLLDVLEKEGVQQVDPFGQQFDAVVHQAVGQKEDPELPEGTVVEVYEKGYEMHGRVIRSAMVVVATGGPAPKEE